MTYRELIGDRASAGLWTAFGYFQQLATDENKAFISRYRDTFGAWAPPVSSLSESVYEAIGLYGAAARQCDEDAPSNVVARLHRQRAIVPRGHVELDGPHVFRQEIHVAESTTGGFSTTRSSRVGPEGSRPVGGGRRRRELKGSQEIQ